MLIHISRAGVAEGPFPIDQVRAMLASGALKPTDHVFHDGLTNWVPAAQS
ncbi:MAG: DUF4339 domain-containing protein, partial [Verrucomicrobia bacterium]|nr:DUF4339 domain-containing protein [Verrucomicrobiota bacterium]